MEKIPFHRLVEKIELGTITIDEAKRFFLTELDPDEPLNLVIGINPNTVDVAKLPSASLFADGLLLDAQRSIEHRNRRKAKPREFKRGGLIIAEGDSWFRLPVIYPDTMIDVLANDYNYQVLNLAHWGDTLDQITSAGEYLRYIGKGRSDTLLFSAGGNDVLGGGELWRFLNLFDVDHADASDAAYYVKQEFYENLDFICDQYMGVLQNIKSSPDLNGTMVFGHGYDYVIPRESGPWLGQPMLRQGLHPEFNKDLCRAIIKIMMDAFNARLAVFQTVFPSNFTYVNLRGTLTRMDEWIDELHARTPGAKLFAAKMNDALISAKSPADVTPPIPLQRRRQPVLV